MMFAFEGMTFTRAGGNTCLTGKVRDQAELQGLLMHVSDLGLTLLEASDRRDITLATQQSRPPKVRPWQTGGWAISSVDPTSRAGPRTISHDG